MYIKHFIVFTILLANSLYIVAIDRNEAIRIADDFMFSSRQNILSECEHHILELDQLYIINYVFRNQAEVGFAVVGKDHKLPSPILAFSPSGRMNLSNATIKNLLENYNKEIKESNEGSMQLALKDSVYYQRTKSVSLPLLKGISWNQRKPYNNGMPLDTNKEKYQVGCTAVAVGQIMKYYEYPCQGMGESTYFQTNEKGEEYSLIANYDSLHIDWSTIKNKYDAEESVSTSKSVSQLLYHCAVAAEAKFSPEVTIGYVTPIVMALYKNFGYHPSIQAIRKNQLSGPELHQLFVRELEASRPIVCCGLSHFFVCDGFADDYFHINWGWGGDMDGYFKLSALGTKANKLNIFDDVIVNIRPIDSQQEIQKTVNLAQPGDLQKFISDEEARTLTSLTIIGKLNGKDFNLLRKMAGSVQSVWECGGELRKLDLSKAEIVADFETSYYKENLTKTKLVKTIRRNNSSGGLQSWTFNFATMNDKEWQTLCQLKGDMDYRKRSWKYVKEDNEYYLQYYLTDHTINTNLFKDCANLRELILPNQTLEIQPRTFANCKSLQHMTIPAQTETLHPEAWYSCLMMRSVSVSPSNPNYMDQEGVIYSKDSTMLVYYPSSKADSAYIMPQSVTHMHSFVFSKTLFLRNIQFSGNLKTIPRYAFYNCPQIRSVKLPDSVEKINPKAFVGCKKLTAVSFPSNLQNVGDDVLFQCGGK